MKTLLFFLLFVCLLTPSNWKLTFNSSTLRNLLQHNVAKLFFFFQPSHDIFSPKPNQEPLLLLCLNLTQSATVDHMTKTMKITWRKWSLPATRKMSLNEARFILGALLTEPHAIHKGLRPNIYFDFYIICSLVFLNYVISRSGSESVGKKPFEILGDIFKRLILRPMPLCLKQLSTTDSVYNDLKLTFEKLEPGHV